VPDNQAHGVAWIYQRIQAYCEDRANGIGGFYAQHSYKKEFFDIFADAIIAGYAGRRARERLKRRNSQLKRKRIPSDLYVVTGHSIRAYLEQSWLVGRNKKSANHEMVKTLCDWWGSWEFGVTHFPPDSSIPRRKRRVKDLFLRSLGKGKDAEPDAAPDRGHM
jgi:hypothetical protein